MREKVLFLSIITIIIFTSCNIPGNSPVAVSIPLFPTSLSGEQTDNRSISRVEIITDPIMDEYGQFLVVPEAASNYNSFIDSLMTEIETEISINPFSNTDYWTEIETAPYNYEHNIDSVIFRTNADFTQFEYVSNSIYFDTRTVYSYARINKQDNYTHSMYLLANLGGGTAPYDASHYFIEIMDTDIKKFIKVLQLVEDIEIEGNFEHRSMYHFVAVTDKTTPDQNTTGRMLSDYIDQGTFTFRFDLGVAADIDYWSQEDPNYNGKDVYGFFNDSELYVTTPDDWPVTGDFISPDTLTVLFAEGIVPTMFPQLISTVEGGNGYVNFEEWDTALFE